MTHKMTEHALDRLRQRAPFCDTPKSAREIIRALDEGDAVKVGQTVTGDAVHEWFLSGGAFVFPIVSSAGEVKTVLSEGMEVETPSGRDVLKRTPIAPGVYNFTAEQYHSDPCPEPALSATIGKLLITKSPRHAWTASPQLNPKWEPTNSSTFDIGRAAHRQVLGRGSEYTAIPEALLSSNGAASTKAAKEFIEECRQRGITPVKQEVADQVKAMAEVCHAALAEFGIVLDPSQSELTAVGEVDGVWCRMMTDNAPVAPVRFPNGTRKVLLDFKTTEDAAPGRVYRAMENYGYDFQDAHYLDTWEAATGERRDFLFIMQEKVPPFEVSVAHLFNEKDHSADWMEDARDKVAYARGTWRDCLDRDNWPGYPRMIVEVMATPYHRQRWQDKMGEAAITNKPGREAIERARQFLAPEGKR